MAVERFRTDVYRGPSIQDSPHLHNRNVREYEDIWMREMKGLEPFDQHLRRQLEKAVQQGRPEVVVVDIGGGDASFVRQFLTQREVGLRSRVFLREHQDLSLRFLSITDAPNEDSFLQEEDIVAPQGVDIDNRQITATSIQYSITSNQTLDELFHLIETPRIDFVTSRDCLMALRPNVFVGVMVDIADYMSEGGEAILVNYSAAGAAFSDDDSEQEKEPFELTVEEVDGIHFIPADELKAGGMKLLEDPDVSDKEIVAYRRKILDSLLRIDALSKQSILNNSIALESPRAVLQWALDRIDDAEKTVVYRTDRYLKLGILERMIKEYPEITWGVNEVVIRMQKADPAVK